MAQTNITTIPTSVIIQQSNLSAYNNIDNFYTYFDPSKDVVSNASKLYINKMFSDSPGISLNTVNGSTIKIGYHPTTNVPVLTVVSGSTDSYPYKEIKALLRGFDSQTFYGDWIPVSSSNIHQKVTNMTAISFANNLIGDRLNIYSPSEQRFYFKINNSYYFVYDYTEFSGFSYDINSQYVNEISNFGLIFTSSTDVPPSTKTAANFAGLFFGELGLIMLYTQSAVPITITGITLSNAVYEENLNSKTFFCRVTNDKYNATTNPTWVTYSSELGANVIRSEVGGSGHTYTAITGIGLYNDQGQLLAIAKLSQPVLKLVDTELHARVVVQY